MEVEYGCDTSPQPQQSIFLKHGHWFRGKKLGKGCFGDVHLAHFSSGDPCDYFWDFPPIAAVKSARLSKASELYWEKKVYGALKDCPFIVDCIGEDITLSDDGRKKNFNVFLEYAPGGNLMDLVKNSKDSRLLEPQVRRFTRSILGGIERIHREGFIHCDIKLENVLLFGDEEEEEFVAKVADLGLAKRAVENNGSYVNGTPSFWAPEVVRDGVQGQAADIWALGCVVFRMLTGEFPWDKFGSLTADELEEVIAMEPLPSLPLGIFSDEAESFMSMCFRSDPGKRPTAAELLRHPFVVGERTVAGRFQNMWRGLVGWFSNIIHYGRDMWWCTKCIVYVACMILMPNNAHIGRLKEQ